jgi:HEAT repeat protein
MDSLGVLRDERAVEPLIALLQGTEVDSVVRALGKIGDSRAIGPLIGAGLRAFGTDLQRDAAGALKEITGQGIGSDRKEWYSWQEKYRAK